MKFPFPNLSRWEMFAFVVVVIVAYSIGRMG